MKSSLLTSNHYRGQWLPWTPFLDVSGAGHTPKGSYTTQGRYFYDRDSRLVIASFAFFFATGMVNNSGGDDLLVLPVPRQMQMDGIGPIGGPGMSIQKPMGQAFIAASLFETNRILNGIIEGSDFTSASGRSIQELAQFFCGSVPLTGSIATTDFASGVATASFGTTLAVAPAAEDIVITPVGAPSTASDKWFMGVPTTTGFTITMTKSGGTDTAGSQAFRWKLRQDGVSGANDQQAVNATWPWQWDTIIGPTLRGLMIYEAAK